MSRTHQVSSTAKWLAVYTKPRWEKKVFRLLVEKGIESYCPLNKVKRKWSDRIKKVEEPLFKSYVFVKISDKQRTEVRTTQGVINFVYYNGKPAVIREKEIQAIKKFLDEHEEVMAVPVDLKIGDRVKISRGVMMDCEGRILELRRKTAKIAIDSLGYILIAYIEKTKLFSARPTSRTSQYFI
ncbi:MAG: UpxY family transcription antiterminator [Chitinophagaceae bacterium]|nr:UpxY family transcription antiterminator [Chitinophagaceae bacterium]